MSTMKELMAKMMNTVGGYVEDKVNVMEELKNEIEAKERELEEKEEALAEIVNQRQLIEIMIMQLDAEERRILEEHQEKTLELAELKERYDSDKLGQMIMNISAGKVYIESEEVCEETNEGASEVCEETNEGASDNKRGSVEDVLETIKNQIKK